MIVIEPDDPALDLWSALVNLYEELPGEWTLIGGQMVALHGFEVGRKPPKATTDADLVVNARVVGFKVASFAVALEDAGYQLEGISAEGVGHRFSNGKVSLDLLAPDGIDSARIDLTTIAPARTISVPGATQALNRSELVTVTVEETTGSIPRPSLLGALLVKARAVDVDDVPQSQLQDLAFLLSLVPDPDELQAELRGSERRWLQRRVELADREAIVWSALSPEEADNGFAAFRILADL